MNATDRQKAGSTRRTAGVSVGHPTADRRGGDPVRELEHDRRKRRRTAAEALRVDVDIDGTGLHKVARTFGEAADNLDAATDALDRAVDDFGRTALSPIA